MAQDQKTKNFQLIHAAESGDAEGVEYWINQGADAGFDGNEPLAVAAKRGHAGCVRVLLECGADVHALSDYSLREAAKDRHPLTVQAILEHDPDAAVALRILYETRDEDSVQFILSVAQGMDLDTASWQDTITAGEQSLQASKASQTDAERIAAQEQKQNRMRDLYDRISLDIRDKSFYVTGDVLSEDFVKAYGGQLYAAAVSAGHKGAQAELRTALATYKSEDDYQACLAAGFCAAAYGVQVLREPSSSIDNAVDCMGADELDATLRQISGHLISQTLKP